MYKIDPTVIKVEIFTEHVHIAVCTVIIVIIIHMVQGKDHNSRVGRRSQDVESFQSHAEEPEVVVHLF